MGIDPGSRLTGFGVIDVDGNRLICQASGCIKVTGQELPEKLGVIYTEIQQLCETYNPAEIAIERVFMYRNADSALKLGQARGAAICATVVHGCQVSEYSPSQIKQAVVGKGNAAKTQVQHMIKSILNLSAMPQEDAADALAMAICHSHQRRFQANIDGIKGIRGGRLHQ